MTSASTRTNRRENRRAADRYALRMSLRYRADAGWRPGHTIDMSARGILIEIPEPLSLGSRLDILMEWPGLYFGKKKVHLFLIGSVTRVDERGTALRIVSHQFREPARRPPLGKTVLPAGLPAYAAAGRAPIGA